MACERFSRRSHADARPPDASVLFRRRLRRCAAQPAAAGRRPGRCASASTMSPSCAEPARAASPTRQPAASLPAELAKALDYDGYRDIRFQPERALWRAEELPFEVMFFHLGQYQTRAGARSTRSRRQGVAPHRLTTRPTSTTARTQLSPQALGRPRLRRLSRLHYALNTPAYKDELVVFLGRELLPRARARASTTACRRAAWRSTPSAAAARSSRASPSSGSSGPRPTPRTLTIYALLESPRATGAYRFAVRPGEQTVTDVQARLFLRAGDSRWPRWASRR